MQMVVLKKQIEDLLLINSKWCILGGCGYALLQNHNRTTVSCIIGAIFSSLVGIS